MNTKRFSCEIVVTVNLEKAGIISKFFIYWLHNFLTQHITKLLTPIVGITKVEVDLPNELES